MEKIMKEYENDLTEINEALEVETDQESIDVLNKAKAQLEKNIADLKAAKETPKKIPNKEKQKKEEAKRKTTGKKAKPEQQKPTKPSGNYDKKTDIDSVSNLAVGEHAKDSDGNIVKRTAIDTYILEYHKNPTDKVAFVKSGDKWLVDCCKKKGIEFKADEIDIAVEHVIEGLDCHFAIEQRKEAAKKNQKYREKYNAKSDVEKMEDTIEKAAETVENRVEDLKEEGKKVSPSKAKDFVADIKKIVGSIKEGIAEETERKKFIKSLIAELQKELD